MKISVILRWYDFWIGFFYDQGKRCLYFFPIPTVGFKIQFGMKKGHLPDIF